MDATADTDAWALVTPRGRLDLDTVAALRRDAVARAISFYAGTTSAIRGEQRKAWRRLRRDGFRLVRVRVEEVAR